MTRVLAGRIIAILSLLLALAVGNLAPAPEWWAPGAANYPPALASVALFSAAGIVLLLLSSEQNERSIVRFPRSPWLVFAWINGAIVACLSYNPEFSRSVWHVSDPGHSLPIALWVGASLLFLTLSAIGTFVALVHWVFYWLLERLGVDERWREWWSRFDRPDSSGRRKGDYL